MYLENNLPFIPNKGPLRICVETGRSMRRFAVGRNIEPTQAGESAGMQLKRNRNTRVRTVKEAIQMRAEVVNEVEYKRTPRLVYVQTIRKPTLHL
jgi:hypothetical protein